MPNTGALTELHIIFKRGASPVPVEAHVGEEGDEQEDEEDEAPNVDGGVKGRVQPEVANVLLMGVAEILY